MQKFKRYENWDLTTVILHEIKSNKDYYAKIISLLNYKFAKNLALFSKYGYINGLGSNECTCLLNSDNLYV